MSLRLVGLVHLVALAALAGCKKDGPELTCKANDVCFVCADRKQQAKCRADPSTSRCAYAEPSHCK